MFKIRSVNICIQKFKNPMGYCFQQSIDVFFESFVELIYD